MCEYDLWPEVTNSYRKVANNQKYKLNPTAMANSNTFHVAMRFPLHLSQWFGIFPLYVGGPTYKCLKIKWFHWRMIYSLTTFLLCLTTFIAELMMLIRETAKTLTILFCLNSIVQIILFSKLTLEWPYYVKEWHNIENTMKEYVVCGKLRKTLIVITIVPIIIGTVEHFLIIGFFFSSSLREEPTFSEAVKNYFTEKIHDAVFLLLPYSLLVGIIFEISSIQTALLWTFTDVFIMLIGVALKIRLEQITKKVHRLRCMKVSDERVWSSTRNDYLQFTYLCRSSNKKISLLIILSFMSNLYFVIKQIHKSLKPLGNTIQTVYFFMSVGLVLVRFIGVCIFGSGLHVEWEDLLAALQSVHSDAYNTEVERFIENVSTSEMVLTGKNFFRLTRGLILKIAGAIVTYELVVIQYTNAI